MALLKLQKVQKALEDAETCIRLKADWDKGALSAICREFHISSQTVDLWAAGYYRKAAALEAVDKYEEVWVLSLHVQMTVCKLFTSSLMLCRPSRPMAWLPSTAQAR